MEWVEVFWCRCGMRQTIKKTMRCAIYTRKSCDDGLEQDFNSLDAQRLSGENYIKSQSAEKWVIIPKHYDDGGYSGGNVNRPALKELLQDIEAGLIDIVVVYKIDRLSRSLIDFVKLLEIFDENNVSFVSVTQSFNTSDSSGRLMLNMLLSFAQFEREIASERIKDKVESSVKKGIWMGGVPPFGYKAQDKKLVVDELDAQIIQFIYSKYIRTESYFQVARELSAAGYRTRRVTHKDGKVTGGLPFEPKAILRILTNPCYKGCVVHKGNVYPGLHKAIIEETTWDQVQEILKQHKDENKKENRSLTPALLRGVIYCGTCGALMKPTAAVKNNITYRYYSCSGHMRYRNCPAERTSFQAPPIEEQVVKELTKIFRSPEIVMRINELAERDKEINKQELMTTLKDFYKVWQYLWPAEQQRIISKLVKRVEVHPTGINLDVDLDDLDELMLNLSEPRE